MSIDIIQDGFDGDYSWQQTKILISSVGCAHKKKGRNILTLLRPSGLPFPLLQIRSVSKLMIQPGNALDSSLQTIIAAVFPVQLISFFVFSFSTAAFILSLLSLSGASSYAISAYFSASS